MLAAAAEVVELGTSTITVSVAPLPMMVDVVGLATLPVCVTVVNVSGLYWTRYVVVPEVTVAIEVLLPM